MKLRHVAVLVPFLASLSLAQEFRATITGNVSDSTGAVMPLVNIQVKNLNTNEAAVAVTNAQGVYSMPFLRPGTYQMSAEAAGFKKYMRDNLVLNVGDTPLDIQAGTRSGVLGVIGVLTGVHKEARLSQESPSHLIPSVADLPALIEAHYS